MACTSRFVAWWEWEANWILEPSTRDGCLAGIDYGMPELISVDPCWVPNFNSLRPTSKFDIIFEYTGLKVMLMCLDSIRLASYAWTCHIKLCIDFYLFLKRNSQENKDFLGLAMNCFMNHRYFENTINTHSRGLIESTTSYLWMSGFSDNSEPEVAH